MQPAPDLGQRSPHLQPVLLRSSELQERRPSSQRSAAAQFLGRCLMNVNELVPQFIWVKLLSNDMLDLSALWAAFSCAEKLACLQQSSATNKTRLDRMDSNTFSTQTRRWRHLRHHPPAPHAAPPYSRFCSMNDCTQFLWDHHKVHSKYTEDVH